MMRRIKTINAFFLLYAISLSSAFAGNCCNSMGGVKYCDSSAGRYVCSNGYYSACYCTRHAVMDLQKIQGCCLWKGGVLKQDQANGFVVCRDGSVSELCSLQISIKAGSSW